MPTSRRALSFLSAGLFVLGSAISAEAWPSEAYRNMVYDTLALLPPSLGKVLRRHDQQLLAGATSLQGETASTIARDALRGQLSPELIRDVESRVEHVVEMVDQHRPFRDTALELGRLLRIAADLSDPSVIGAASPELRRVAPEYLRFIGLHLSEIPLVYDKSLPSPLEGATVQGLLDRLTEATTASVGPLSDAFWKDGGVVPAASFDYRSVPYAETSLSYSRGVTAASHLWLSAWAKAHGDFSGYRFTPKKH